MATLFSRAAGIAILCLLLVGAYVLISGASASVTPTATGKISIKPPKQFAGDVQEGTGI
jgi:hypothetical protein